MPFGDLISKRKGRRNTQSRTLHPLTHFIHSLTQGKEQVLGWFQPNGSHTLYFAFMDDDLPPGALAGHANLTEHSLNADDLTAVGVVVWV